MEEIGEVIKKHKRNQEKLKSIYLGNSNVSYDKSVELQKQQDEEWKKYIFFKKLRKEIDKNVKTN